MASKTKKMTAYTVSATMLGMSKTIRKFAEAAVDEIAEEIYTTSTEVYCPVDTGELKGSAVNEVTQDNSFAYTRSIYYTAPHAVIVHEVSIPHWNPPTASWKYLEIPYNRIAPKYPAILKQKLGGFGK